MPIPELQINLAQAKDLSGIQALYNWHSEHGFSTFRPRLSDDDMQAWWQPFAQKQTGYQAWVLLSHTQVMGVTCSFPYRQGGVFADTRETSIYLSPEIAGQGWGTRLYQHLFEQLAQEPVHRVVVGIALPNAASIALHHKLGFTDVGTFDEYAYYQGAYRSSLWMQKQMNYQHNP